jgi:hypothetical protein
MPQIMFTSVPSEIKVSDCTDAPEAEIFSRTTVSLWLWRASRQRSFTRSEHKKRGSARRSGIRSIGGGQAREFKLGGIVTALDQLTYTLFYGIADGFDTPQRQRLWRVNFKRNEFAGERKPLFQAQPLRCASDSLLGITGCSNRHGMGSEAFYQKDLVETVSTMTEPSGMKANKFSASRIPG